MGTIPRWNFKAIASASRLKIATHGDNSRIPTVSGKSLKAGAENTMQALVARDITSPRINASISG